MDNFIHTTESIWYWGLALIVIFPILVLLLNELSYKVKQKDKQLALPINAFRNYVLPLIVLLVLLIKILNFDRNALSIKVIETLIWVVVINAGLALVNRLFFIDAKKDTWRGNVPQLFLDIFRVFFVLFGGAIVLSMVWDVELGGLVTALGLGSFVLGLALQDTLGNLFSGIALVYERPFSVGDYIHVEGQSGQVIEMNWRAVRIKTREGKLVVIPHLMIGQGMIINFSKPSKLHIVSKTVGFSHSDPPNKVKEALLETCLNTNGILPDPLPEIKTIDYGDSAIIYEMEYAIDTFQFYEEVSDELMSKIWYMAQRHNLTIPFPQLVTHAAESSPSPNVIHEEMVENNLQKLSEFLPVKKEKTKHLKATSKVQYYGKGEVIFYQGATTADLYIIMEGKVSLSVKGTNGETITTNQLSKGDFFGEVALLNSRSSSVTATATTDVSLMLIPINEVIGMVSKNSRLAAQLDEVLDGYRRSIAHHVNGN